jgi:glyoxylase-like metal-dependent hydrolase (beta-lactamase superfamily II)
MSKIYKGVDKMRITDKVYKLESTKGGYAFLVKDDISFIIDTGMPKKAKAILAELEQLEIKKSDIKHILLTHNDIDHVGNAAELARETGASLWCSEIDIPYIMGERKRFGLKKYISRLMKYEKPLSILPFDKGKLPKGLQIIETPGHTPGHVCFIYDGVLFAGDILMKMRGKLTKSRSIMTWDMDQVNSSLKKLLKYEFKYICPAHSEPMEVNHQLMDTIGKL